MLKGALLIAAILPNKQTEENQGHMNMDHIKILPLSSLLTIYHTRGERCPLLL